MEFRNSLERLLTFVIPPTHLSLASAPAALYPKLSVSSVPRPSGQSEQSFSICPAQAGFRSLFEKIVAAIPARASQRDESKSQAIEYKVPSRKHFGIKCLRHRPIRQSEQNQMLASFPTQTKNSLSHCCQP